MDQAAITASPRLRIIFLPVASSMLFLCGWSLVPPIQNWNNPYDDGFSYVGVFYATTICLPTGLFLLIGSIAARPARRAGPFCIVRGCGTLVIVVAFLIFQQIANSMGGLG